MKITMNGKSLFRSVLMMVFLALSVADQAAARPSAQKRNHRTHPLVSAPQQAFKRLSLSANAVLIQHPETGEVFYQKNAHAPLPIASLTKLMTAIVILDSALSMHTPITIAQADVDILRNSASRLAVGVSASREDLLQLALMSSENRAAAALARTYVGGTAAFVRQMNQKAKQLGMLNARFADATGLSNGNYASANDIARLVAAAARYPEVHAFSTADSYYFNPLAGGKEQFYKNTNPLLRSRKKGWDIVVSKTGFTNEAGKCLAMKANIANTAFVIVLLDSEGHATRLTDANRVRRWLEAHPRASKRGFSYS